MSKKVTLTPEQVESFKAMWLDGAPVRAIAQRFGIDIGTVARRRETYNLPARPKRNISPAAEYDTQIMELHRSGLHPFAIAKLLDGPGHVSITTWIKGKGLTPHPAGRGGKPADAAELSRRAERHEEHLRQSVVTGCGRCNEMFDGTLADGKRWFRSHVCAVAA